jgi:DNA-binding SARP family transcriptional activator
MAGTQTMRIQTLGSAEIIIGQTAVRPDSAVAFGLLLYLGLTAGERVPRARLVELFWPDQPETQSRHALRQLLYRLRRVGLPLAEGGEELRVDASVVECDAAPMLAPSWSATCGERDAMNASQFLTDFNPEISGPFSEWLDELRNRVARRYADASLRHLATARREARWSDVFDWSTRCLAVDPLNQDATYALAEATAMRGAKVEAVRILDEYSREIGSLDGRIGISTKAMLRRVSEAQSAVGDHTVTRPPMFGRDEEIARLVRLVDGAGVGRGGFALITGVAGIGKSRLATELRREVIIRGYASVAISLFSGDRQLPFSLVTAIVTQLLKLPGALGCSPESLRTLQQITEFPAATLTIEVTRNDPAVRRFEIREAIADLCAALESEVALMIQIDDLHYGDRWSLEILSELIERTTASRVLWICTSRPSGDRPAFRALTTIDLTPLSRAACRQMVDFASPELSSTERDRLTEACSNISGGNPLFARELIQSWDLSGREDALPRSVRRAIADRISRLDGSALRILQVVAMLGSIATLRRVSVVADLAPDDMLTAIEELDVLGIVVVSDDQAEIGLHDLWREEVIKSIRPLLRRALHSRIADIVEPEALSEREVALFWHAAIHRGKSGEKESALRLLISCSEILVTSGLPDEAAATLHHALSFCRTGAQELLVRQQRLEALHAAARWAQIQTEIPDVARLARSINCEYDPHDELELLSIEAMCRADKDIAGALRASLNCGRATSAKVRHRILALTKCAIAADNLCDDDSLREANSLLRLLANDENEHRAEVLTVSTIFNTILGDLDIAIRDSGELVTLQRSHPRISTLTLALRIATTPLRIAGEMTRATELLNESLRLSEKYSLAEDAATCCDALATISLEKGDLDTSREWLARAESWASHVGTGYWQLSLKALRGALAIEYGDADAALMELGSSIDLYAGDQLVRQGLMCLSVLSGAFRIKNRTRELRESVEAIERLLPRILYRGRLDHVCYQYASGLIHLGEAQKAHDFVSGYLSASRRDKGDSSRLKLLTEPRPQ